MNNSISVVGQQGVNNLIFFIFATVRTMLLQRVHP